MNQMSTIFSANHINLYLTPENDPFDINTATIKKYWDSDPLVQCGKVFNGKILNLLGFYHQNDSLEIHCTCVDFKDFYISRKQPKLQLPIQPLGISGIIIGYDNEIPYTYIAKRSFNVAHYAGFYELVPSGHLDDKNTLSNNKVDYKEKLLEEFEEETNLSRAHVTEIQEFGFIYDKTLDVYDIACKMTLSLTRPQLDQTQIPLDEYTSSFTITEQDLPSFLRKHDANIIPTSKALIELGFPYSI